MSRTAAASWLRQTGLLRASNPGNSEASGNGETDFRSCWPAPDCHAFQTECRAADAQGGVRVNGGCGPARRSRRIPGASDRVRSRQTNRAQSGWQPPPLSASTSPPAVCGSCYDPQAGHNPFWDLLPQGTDRGRLGLHPIAGLDAHSRGALLLSQGRKRSHSKAHHPVISHSKTTTFCCVASGTGACLDPLAPRGPRVMASRRGPVAGCVLNNPATAATTPCWSCWIAAKGRNRQIRRTGGPSWVFQSWTCSEVGDRGPDTGEDLPKAVGGTYSGQKEWLGITA